MNNSSDKKIGIVTIYAGENENQSRDSAMAWYTRTLVFAMEESNKNSVVIFSNIKVKKKIFFDQGLEVNECWYRGKISLIWNILAEVKKYKNLKTIHIQHEFNLFGGSIAAIYYLLLIAILRKKIVVTYHGVISQKNIDLNFKKVNQLNMPTIIVKAFFVAIYRISSIFIDRVIVHEKYFKDVLISEYGFKDNQVSVIPIGVLEISSILSKDTSRNILKLPSDKKIILFFGFLAGYKGLNLLLDAFELLNSQDYFLLIAGGKSGRLADNREYNEWFESIKKRTYSVSNIQMTDFIPADQVPTYFMASDLLVLPYLQMLSASGPMSLAITYGLPFVASDVFKDVLENKKIIFEKNPTSLKNLIERFFVNKEEYISYIREMKVGRSWENVASKTYNLYQD